MALLSRYAGSLLGRLALGYVLVTAILSGAWLWTLYGPLTETVFRLQEKNLRAVAQSASVLLSAADVPLQDTVRRLAVGTDLRLTVIDADGVVLADSAADPRAMENHRHRPEVRTALLGGVGVSRRVSPTRGLEELYVAVPGTLADEPIAVRASQPVTRIRNLSAQTRRLGLGLLAAALVTATLVAVRAARATTEPVRRLSQAAERMAAGDLAVPLPEVPSDLAGLARSLEDLRSQIRARLDALETERKTLRATLDGLDVVVFLIDDGHIRFANRTADTMFRAPEGGWVGTPVKEAGLPTAVTAHITDHIDTIQPVAFELPPEATGRTLRLLVSPLERGEAGRRTIVVISDVTERARLDRVRRDFVANASHELKTPAAGIRLLAQAAESAAADGDAEQALAFTRQIEAETERLQQLVNDLLDLSRLESAPRSDELADVREAVERAAISHRASADRKGLKLSMRAEAVRGGDVFVCADPTDLAIALDNLLDNAIAYTDEGEVALEVRVEDEEVVFTVSDTGPGIAPEHHQRIFERFYRVDKGRSREMGGTGLGLALVRHVAERNGGSISLSSEVGKGSSFTLRLPRAR